MTGFAGEFKIHDNIVSQGVQVFKLASMQNFVQGRRMMMVAAVCLYTAARQNEKCTVMMIDFADACQVLALYFIMGCTAKCFRLMYSNSDIASNSFTK